MVISRAEGIAETAGGRRRKARCYYRLLETGLLTYSAGERSEGRLATLTWAPRPASPIMSECSWQ
jgi:hypothetical protein